MADLEQVHAAFGIQHDVEAEDLGRAAFLEEAGVLFERRLRLFCRLGFGLLGLRISAITRGLSTSNTSSVNSLGPFTVDTYLLALRGHESPEPRGLLAL